MQITILTLFPDSLKPYFASSIPGRAEKKGLVQIRLVNIRDYAYDSHKTVDDRPYGGGAGMILKVDIVHKAIEANRLKGGLKRKNFKEKVVLTDPTGKIFRQSTARRFSRLDHLIIVSGHYEGIDERISNFIDETVSIGRYILTGGELPATVIADCVIRLIPNVLPKEAASKNESYSLKNIKEAPQYTRPSEYRGFKVPEILKGGNHRKIDDWNKTHPK
ncbi:tRNA (guanosine(37)-N1)-methyltransferase TrmD [Candidatus Gottesmanbacteria bacterium RIFCSPLOWO2_02_FULL_42_29]|uniref:tRNA (guanine-N(1)-)-methyltransferase n=2 Tax=Candidatus Gottesmaniibacteriota TaxID=1752720 RepID=A0A1F6BBN6_9BACT|nr:MAG: tRNA (guanine-N(1)-)-methyltransferase [Candidatus Gottesmanbacteria bacterium GW2011_GWA2_42_18]OGG10769.1 MAG: tRNA (guanosine(37)-N1)-methyltransferase TrmD [Candidatus Gottesmanbacteria bacterium RIFCSPHIGHO2_01_FULL_42_27]OGG21932.1 MAG: tRNA (guanosine(37)-N1)-methyltransferase TrmD [Candidatus Gottesmanbacteria bacterium RIFCSPHIGHO2_12_FULL_43_26]OGG34172.1 MAG: tRNA (guanosine(37)-N1)-methyltransferase TrmD [Candidatus Gottesmanbacteria bacterium RIFCSPLOWO2_01_FULL_42_22]OGG35